MGVLWLALSGHFHDPLLLGFGLFSAAFCVFLAWRLHILDAETSPYHHIISLLVYLPWLMGEIIKTNIIVVRTVLSPDMILTPRLVRVKHLPRTDLARTIFANSITLTPGTVSIDMDADEIIVHALLKEMVNPADFANMAARSARAAGENPITTDEGKAS